MKEHKTITDIKIAIRCKDYTRAILLCDKLKDELDEVRGGVLELTPQNPINRSVQYCDLCGNVGHSQNVHKHDKEMNK